MREAKLDGILQSLRTALVVTMVDHTFARSWMFHPITARNIKDTLLNRFLLVVCTAERRQFPGFIQAKERKWIQHMAFDGVSCHKIYSLEGMEIFCEQDMMIPTSIILKPVHHAFPGQAAALLLCGILHQHAIASGGTERIHNLYACTGIDLHEQTCHLCCCAV